MSETVEPLDPACELTLRVCLSNPKFAHQRTVERWIVEGLLASLDAARQRAEAAERMLMRKPNEGVTDELADYVSRLLAEKMAAERRAAEQFAAGWEAGREAGREAAAKAAVEALGHAGGLYSHQIERAIRALAPPQAGEAIDWEQRCADLYQVIGSLRAGVMPTDEDWARALDYADGGKINGDLLPWPSDIISTMWGTERAAPQRQEAGEPRGPLGREWLSSPDTNLARPRPRTRRPLRDRAWHGSGPRPR